MKDTAGEAARPRTALTPLDVQQKEFRVSRFGGYKMREVDEFLDTVTDTLSAMAAEVERLRSRPDPAPVVGMPDIDDVSRQADEIIRRAREEAAALVAAAKERAALTGTSAVPGAMSAQNRTALNAFLANERGFLQSLAGLVQGHAETVKGLARASRPAPRGDEAPRVAAEDRVAVPEAEVDEAGPQPDESAPATGERATPETTVLLPKAERPVRIDEPEGASVAGADTEGDPGGAADRSLKELFWGED